MEGIVMKTVLILMLCLFSLASASAGRNPGIGGDFPRPPEPWYGSQNGTVDALFIFLAYDDYVPDSAYACGDSYWNPLSQPSGSGWAVNYLCSSYSEPAGSPYHWNGGLGSAMDALGYSWNWFPGYTGRCGQVIPDAGYLAFYKCVFVLTFDAYRSVTLTEETREILQTCIENGGHVVLVSQDAMYSGVPESWLMKWFNTGEITQDVVSGTSPFSAAGMVPSFLLGWSGTALIENFSTGAGGNSEGNWWADDLSGDGCISNGSYVFASCNEFYGNIFSTFEFETCYPSEVQSIAEYIMNWAISSSLERSTWGEIKANSW